MTIGQNEMAQGKWNTQDQADFLRQLYDLMDLCVKRYTGGDSTSVPKEVAQELLNSILFVLGSLNPGANLKHQYQDGLKILNQKMEFAKALWREVCLSMPDVENMALKDTLKEIGGFFSRYDPLFAHEIRCMIDYPLCRPIPESLKGVDYITDYLTGLKTEQEFINAFSVKNVRRLLEAYCMDVREQLVNLYEPVAVNALGLALIDEDPTELDIPAHKRQKIGDKLANTDWKPAFSRAVNRLLTVLNLHSVKAESYLEACAGALYPRLKAAMEAGDLGWIFFSKDEPVGLSMKKRG